MAACAAECPGSRQDRCTSVRPSCQSIPGALVVFLAADRCRAYRNRLGIQNDQQLRCRTIVLRRRISNTCSRRAPPRRYATCLLEVDRETRWPQVRELILVVQPLATPGYPSRCLPHG